MEYRPKVDEQEQQCFAEMGYLRQIQIQLYVAHGTQTNYLLTK